LAFTHYPFIEYSPSIMMVLGIIGAVTGSLGVPLAVVAVPNSAVATSTAVVGLAEGTVGQQQKAQQDSNTDNGSDPQDDPRLAKFTLLASCDVESSSPTKNQGPEKQVVLHKGKLYLDDAEPESRHFPDGHPFSGFYLEYPSGEKPPPLGLVSTISREPPELNWVYVDKNTLELKYGNKTQSIPHIFSPWDWTQDRQGLTLEGWEGFVALEESSGVWVLCYDRKDDLLEGLRGGRHVVECTLERRVLEK